MFLNLPIDGLNGIDAFVFLTIFLDGPSIVVVKQTGFCNLL